MKIWILEHPGLEELALTEVFELVKGKGKILGRGIVEAEVELSGAVFLSCHGQSFKKILLAVDSNNDYKKLRFSSVKNHSSQTESIRDGVLPTPSRMPVVLEHTGIPLVIDKRNTLCFNFDEFLSKGMMFKVEVEGVKGQDNRIEISKEISSHIFSLNKDKELKIDYKKALAVFFVYFSGEKYFLGVDLTGFELNKRAYRVFPHQSSFKGDISYYLVRKSGYKKGETLGIGLVKDGTLAIEAALFNFGFTVNKSGFAWEKFSMFSRVEGEKVLRKKNFKKNIYGFDENMMNLRAAKKNAQIAGVADLIELNKFGLDETDVKFKEGELDRMIFHVTKKDEDKLNEIYHQATYVLKKKGVLLMVGRNSWEISVPSKFKLVSEEEIKRGESRWKIWVMEKK